MEIKFARKKKDVISKFKEVVKEIIDKPDSVRNDTIPNRDFVKFSMREIKTKNKISGEIMLRGDLSASQRKVIARDQLSGEYTHHNYTELRISRTRYAITVVIDGTMYRVDVWGLMPDENMAIGTILLSVAFDMTPSHLLDFARYPGKGAMPNSFFMKGHYLHDILSHEALKFNNMARD
jgi:hypothetical protein